MNLFFARACIDHDKFIFNQIDNALRQKTGRIILLVPEQFTLQAERNAFEFIPSQGFIDLEIMSPSSLARRILSKEGGSREIPINKTGCQMMLSKIIREEKEGFEIFGKAAKTSSFTEIMTDLITEMKQYNVKPDMLAETIEKIDKNAILLTKLNDILKIYSRYEEDVRGRFADPEDISNIVADRISISEDIKNSTFWISGFDYLTPQNLKLISAVEQNAAQTNIVMLGSRDRNSSEVNSFPLFEIMSQKLRKISNDNGHEFHEEQINDKFKANRPEEILHIEREFFSFMPEPMKEKDNNEKFNIEICRSSSFYSEAETIAVKIAELVRDKEFRYRDIFVACNDTELRASVLKRVFQDYEIPVFIDKKRDSSFNPCIEFIVSLLESVRNNMRYDDVFAMIKTGFTPIKREITDSLEYYCVRYKIKGNKWATEFKYGEAEFGADGLAEIEAARCVLYDFIKSAKQCVRGKKTVREKTESLFKFLNDTVKLPEQIEEKKLELESGEVFEYAQESAQIWELIVGMFDQLILLLGDDELSNEDYTELLKSGFKAIEMGVIPPSNDLVTVGTLMRSRSGRIKVLFVAGANDGVLPANQGSDSLISEEEQKRLSELNLEICKSSEIKRREEDFALYKLLSKTENLLWIGYDAANSEGGDLSASEMITKIHEMFPEIREEKDVISDGSPELLSQTHYPAALHLSQAVRRAADGEPMEAYWLAVYKSLHDGRMLPAGINDSFIYMKPPKKIDKDRISSLFGRGAADKIKLSPSAIEKYAKCPFSYFIYYGLSPHEREPFEVGYREIGDVYHACLKALSDELTQDGIPMNDENSPWMTITETECYERVSSLIDDLSDSYREGLLKSGTGEMYRSHRLKTACGRAAWAMITQVRKGRIKAMFFETEFGKGKTFPNVDFGTEDGRTASISGKIDRVDLLVPDGKDDEIYVKIIDYKSGSTKFNLDEVKEGKSLQLMLYLKSVMTGLEKEGKYRVMPAGVFYFPLKEGVSNMSSYKNEEIKDEVDSNRDQKHTLDGIFIDNDSIIECITGDITGKSSVIPVKKGEGGYSASGGRLLTEEEFQLLIAQVDLRISEMCENLLDGRIPATPYQTKEQSACTYCGLRSICTHE